MYLTVLQGGPVSTPSSLLLDKILVWLIFTPYPPPPPPPQFLFCIKSFFSFFFPLPPPPPLYPFYLLLLLPLVWFILTDLASVLQDYHSLPSHSGLYCTDTAFNPWSLPSQSGLYCSIRIYSHEYTQLNELSHYGDHLPLLSLPSVTSCMEPLVWSWGTSLPMDLTTKVGTGTQYTVEHNVTWLSCDHHVNVTWSLRSELRWWWQLCTVVGQRVPEQVHRTCKVLCEPVQQLHLTGQQSEPWLGYRSCLSSLSSQHPSSPPSLCRLMENWH